MKEVKMTREGALKIFFKVVDQEDPYWMDMVEDHLIFDEDGEDVIAWPSVYSVGRALGFSDTEMEVAEGLEAGRLKELGL